jgi:hypothetical protein
MPSRNLSLIRRHLNRLHDLIKREADKYPIFKTIGPFVAEKTDAVNGAWQNYQQISVKGDRERAERDTAIAALIGWIQRYRSAILMTVPGADQNLGRLPSGASTPDEVIHVAEDMQRFLENDESAAPIREDALSTLGPVLDAAKKETGEAMAALPAEATASNAFTQACLDANEALIHGINIVRSIFGPTHPEYRYFIQRSSAEEEQQLEQEAATGEA